MKRIISIIVSMLLATIFGVYGQWIANFMSEKPLAATYYLTACTVLSMLLYAVSYIIASMWLKSKSVWKVAGVFVAISIVAVPVSMLSFWATVMWWG